MTGGEAVAAVCLCGTEIPARGIDFEPMCRHCERIRIFRLFRPPHDGIAEG